MEKKFKRTLVTTALPYANGPVHIGHLAGVYAKMFGVNDKSSETRFGESTDAPKNIGKTAQKIIDFVISDPPMSAETMAYKIGISSRAVEKQIAKLRSMGILSREGADFGGYWRIVINPQTEK